MQNDLSGTVRTEDVKHLIDNQWNSVGGATLAEVQEEAKKYKELSMRYAPAHQRFEADQKLLAAIREKAPILFPAFVDVQGAAVATEDKERKITYTRFLAVISCKQALTPEEQERLQKWLNSEARLPVVFTLQILPAETPAE